MEAIMNDKEMSTYAYQRSSYWLAEWNRLQEEGKTHTKAYQIAQRKAQYWLDRLNEQEGYGPD